MLLPDRQQDANWIGRELEAPRARYITQFLQNAQSSYRIASTLGDRQLTAGDRTLADSHLSAIRNVTAEDALAALAASLPGLRFGAAGPDGALDEKLLLADQGAGLEIGAVRFCWR